MSRLLDLDRWKDVWRRAQGRGTYPHELAFLLTHPARKLIHSPARLARCLGLEALPAGARVLELGPGPGYYSPEIARHLPRGRLALCDLQIEMLRKARRRLRRAGLANWSCTQAEASALPFAPASFDVVFLVAVLGEVPDPPACLAAVARVLRPGGLLSVTELPGDPDALKESEVRALAEGAGLAWEATSPVRGGFSAGFRRAEQL
jgi:ubiquinone/menaquinone biosynthesis C-methylase UbiE